MSYCQSCADYQKEIDRLRSLLKVAESALEFALNFFAALENGLPADDPLRRYRESYHAPLKDKCSSALAKLRQGGKSE